MTCMISDHLLYNSASLLKAKWNFGNLLVSQVAV